MTKVGDVCFEIDGDRTRHVRDQELQESMRMLQSSETNIDEGQVVNECCRSDLIPWLDVNDRIDLVLGCRWACREGQSRGLFLLS
jgi:hypothetical protein